VVRGLVRGGSGSPELPVASPRREVTQVGPVLGGPLLISLGGLTGVGQMTGRSLVNHGLLPLLSFLNIEDQAEDTYEDAGA
jgi:hypothetical protein